MKKIIVLVLIIFASSVCYTSYQFGFQEGISEASQVITATASIDEENYQTKKETNEKKSKSPETKNEETRNSKTTTERNTTQVSQGVFKVSQEGKRISETTRQTNGNQTTATEISSTRQCETTTRGSEITPKQFRRMGVVNYNGWKFTWYSERVLPGNGLRIPGRWSDTDFVRDGDGYICCACIDRPRGSVIGTPWGNAKVYDTGCDHGTVDIYVTW